MKNRNLSIEDFNNLSYALIKQEEVVADQKFDGHMYSDTENKITIGIGFNIEAEGILPIICAKKMNLLISSSKNNEYILEEILNDTTDMDVVNKVADCISSVIKDFHTNNKIHANDKQNLTISSSQLTQEDINYINRSLQSTPSSNARKQDKQQTGKQNTQDIDKHLRALQLEKAVNKKISDTIKQINNSKQYIKQYELFELILTQEDAKEIFIFLSRTFHKELINSLLAGKNGLKVFHGEQLKEYSKLIISFLCGHYQMPAKFNKYKDPTDFFHSAIYKNNSRFLSWFGIRYYIDLVSASKNNQYNNYIKRRLHEAAIFELVERKEDGTIDIYQTSKDIFTYLNIIFKFIKVQDNVPLAGYDNKTFLEFIKTHSYSNLIDKVATNQKNNISFSELDEYSAVFKNVTKIQDLKNCLQNNISIDENKYFQSILDFATYDDIFKPFVLYINEQFSKDILNIDFKLNEIYVVANTNLNEFQSSVKKYFNETSTEVKNILLISQLNWGLQQRFETLLDESKQNSIILYLLKNREHVITMNSITQNNFRILLYDDESINAVALLGKYILINDENDEKLLYQHEENKEIHAEYIPNENIFIIMYQKTKISLRNFFPSKFHAGIVLSNQEEIKEDPTAVSQVGEINIKIELKIDEMININELDKKNYYLFNTKTNELIDGIIEVCGDNASVCFKINADPEDISNTKLIFSLNKEDFADKKEANIKSHDTTVVDKATRDSKQTTTKASVTQKDIKGIITGVELVEPIKENLPDINSYMETTYKFRATTSGVLNTDYIKWSYSVLTNKDYYGLISVKDKHKPLSFTGEEISFKPSDILNDEEKVLLSNNSVKLCVFAYMKSPALYNSYGKTHSLLLNATLINNIKPVIILDAGHGISVKNGNKQYNGAIYPKQLHYGDPNLLIVEDVVVLDFVKKLQSRLLALNYVVELTRKTDRYVLNTNRARHASIIAKAFPDAEIIFLSIHLNSSAHDNIISGGIEFLYSDTKKKLKRENIKLIECIKSSLENSATKYCFRKNDTVVKNSVTVLADNTVPSVLLELGFVNNKHDRNNLLNDSYLNLLADDVVNGINNYIEVK